MPHSSSRTFFCRLSLIAVALFFSTAANAEKLPDTLIFTHVPKAAGISLNHNIAKNIAGDKIQLIYSPPYEQPLDFSKEQDFLSKPKAQLGKYQFIAGHFNFGIHKKLPNDSKYITLLRNPLSRISSAYRYYQFDKDKTITQFLDAGFFEADNGMVRRISGVGNSVPIGDINAAHLQLAMKNIEFSYSLAGTVEQYNEFIFVLGQMYNWQMSPSIHENATKSHPNHTTLLSDEDKELILERNTMDSALHAFVTKKFTLMFDSMPLQTKLRYIHFIKKSR